MMDISRYDPFTTKAKRHIVAGIQRRGHQLIAELAGFDETGASAWAKPPVSYPEDACLALLSGMGNAIAFHLDPLIFPPSPAEPPKPKAPEPADEHERPKPMDPLLTPEQPDTPKTNVPAPKPFEIGFGPQLAIGLVTRSLRIQP